MLIKHSRILRAVDKKLRHVFGENYDELYMLMNKYNIYVTGDFILECIYQDDKWKDSEITFYCLCRDEEISDKIEEWFKDIFKKNTYRLRDTNHINSPVFNKVGKCTKYVFKHKYHYEGWQAKILYKVYNVFTILVNKVKYVNAKDYIWEMLGPDISKNIFYMNDGLRFLELHSTFDIYKKVTFFDIVPFVTVKDIEKLHEYYTSRGIVLCLDNDARDRILDKVDGYYYGSSTNYTNDSSIGHSKDTSIRLLSRLFDGKDKMRKFMDYHLGRIFPEYANSVLCHNCNKGVYVFVKDNSCKFTRLTSKKIKYFYTIYKGKKYCLDCVGAKWFKFI